MWNASKPGESISIPVMAIGSIRVMKGLEVAFLPGWRGCMLRVLHHLHLYHSLLSVTFSLFFSCGSGGRTLARSAPGGCVFRPFSV